MRLLMTKFFMSQFGFQNRVDLASKLCSFTLTFLSQDRQMYLGYDPLEVKHVASQRRISQQQQHQLYYTTLQGIAILKIPLDFPCICSLKFQSRLVIGEDSLSRYFFFFLLLLRVRHEIENLREKSSIQMAFSKRQKTVKV